jgi:hypothetical protein
MRRLIDCHTLSDRSVASSEVARGNPRLIGSPESMGRLVYGLMSARGRSVTDETLAFAAFGVNAALLYMHKLGKVRSKPNPNLAKFRQIRPSLRKTDPRKWLGFPWISLSVSSLFKDLRRPLGPKNIFGALSVQSADPHWHMRECGVLGSAGSSDAAQVIHCPHYSDDF